MAEAARRKKLLKKRRGVKLKNQRMCQTTKRKASTKRSWCFSVHSGENNRRNQKKQKKKILKKKGGANPLSSQKKKRKGRLMVHALNRAEDISRNKRQGRIG